MNKHFVADLVFKNAFFKDFVGIVLNVILALTLKVT